MLDWSPFVALVGRHQRFVLTTHLNPDGDALGSVIALAEGLERLGKSARPVVASPVPARYDCFSATQRVRRFLPPGDEYRDAEVIIVVDTGTWNQIGEFGPYMRSMAVPKVVIDHHVTQDDMDALRLVDVSAEAAGRLVHQALRALGVGVPGPAAEPLFAALAMDTGWFRHSNTTADTFELAADLVRGGARPTRLYERLFDQNSLPRLKLIGRVLDRLRIVEGGRVAVSELLASDFADLGASVSDSDDLANYTRGPAGVDVGVFLLERPDGMIKVSLRARPPLDATKVVEPLKGGGHKAAAGATLAVPLAEARGLILAAVGDLLRTAPAAEDPTTGRHQPA